jgi:hypothetical protein
MTKFNFNKTKKNMLKIILTFIKIIPIFFILFIKVLQLEKKIN